MRAKRSLISAFTHSNHGAFSPPLHCGRETTPTVGRATSLDTFFLNTAVGTGQLLTFSNVYQKLLRERASVVLVGGLIMTTDARKWGEGEGNVDDHSRKDKPIRQQPHLGTTPNPPRTRARIFIVADDAGGEVKCTAG